MEKIKERHEGNLFLAWFSKLLSAKLFDHFVFPWETDLGQVLAG